MEQTTKKIFAWCPRENQNIQCSKCPEYQLCLQKRQMRLLKKEVHNMHSLLNALGVFLMFSMVIIVILLWNTLHTIPALQDTIDTLEKQIEELNEKVSSDASTTSLNELTPNGNQGSKYGQPEITTTQVSQAEKTQKAVLSADGPSETYYYDISYEDKVLMAKTVWVESGTECFEGQVAVAAVILNRFYSDIPYFDKESIESVITQPYQFADGSNVSMETLEAHPSCMEAVEAACKGWDPTRAMFPEGALYFYAPKLVTGYQKEVREGIRYLQIGNVNFHLDFEKVN